MKSQVNIEKDRLRRLLTSLVMSVVLVFGIALPTGSALAGEQPGGPGNSAAELGLTVQAGDEDSSTVEGIVARMTLDEKVSQMIIPAIRTWNGVDVTSLDADGDLAKALRKHQYGGIILFGANVKDTEQVATLVSDLQVNNAKINATTNIPYFMTVDQEGGAVVRLVSGTRMTGNMAIGATGKSAESNALVTGLIVGSELQAIGFNTDFAPTIDVNSNPSNPVIGTRSFSDDAFVVSKLGDAYVDGLARQNIIATYKHFPGHGDTNTDSHTGTPSVDKTIEQLRQTELVPFKAAIANGADMIMTAHITLPKVDDEVEFADGTKGYYPATMSRKLISGILRGELGYNGVVVADALEMDALYESKLVEGETGGKEATSSTEYKANLAEKVINAGVDILLVPTDLKSSSAADFYDAYIEAIMAKVKSGDIPIDRINESVTRILTLKHKYGILDTDTTGENIDGVCEAAQEIVGSASNHEAESRIASSAITMLKNERRALPLSGTDGKIVFVGRLKGDNVSIANAVEQLQEDGVIDPDAYVNNLVTGTTSGSAESKTKITIGNYCSNASTAEPENEKLTAAIAEADSVVVFSTNWGIATLQPTHAQYKCVSGIIADAHKAGAEAVLLSTNLPYDAARYQDADAIILCYMSSGADIDPTERTTGKGGSNAYNPNIPAAIDAMYGFEEVEGTLPVNIPAMVEAADGTVSYSTTEVLYKRGTGLSYEDSSDPDDAGGGETPIYSVNPIWVSVTAPVAATFMTSDQVIANPLVVSDAKGAVTYSKILGDGRISIERTTGDITIAGNTPVGSYTVTVRIDAAGDDTHEAATVIEEYTVKVNKEANTLAVKAASSKLTARYGKKAVFEASKAFRVTKNVSGGTITYQKQSGNKKIVVAKNGRVAVKKGTPAGSYTVKVRVTSASKGNYKAKAVQVALKVVVGKAANTLSVKAKKSVFAAVAGKKTTIKAGNAFKVVKNKSGGKLTYRIMSVPKAAKGKVTLSKAGNITVKPGLKAGKTYTIKAKATSAKTKNYKAKAVNVNFKVRVK